MLTLGRLHQERGLVWFDLLQDGTKVGTVDVGNYGWHHGRDHLEVWDTAQIRLNHRYAGGWLDAQDQVRAITHHNDCAVNLSAAVVVARTY